MAVQSIISANEAIAFHTALEDAMKRLQILCNGLDPAVFKPPPSWFRTGTCCDACTRALQELGSELLVILKGLKVLASYGMDKLWRVRKCAWKVYEIKESMGKLALHGSQLATRLLWPSSSASLIISTSLKDGQHCIEGSQLNASSASQTSNRPRRTLKSRPRLELHIHEDSFRLR